MKLSTQQRGEFYRDGKSGSLEGKKRTEKSKSPKSKTVIRKTESDLQNLNRKTEIYKRRKKRNL